MKIPITCSFSSDCTSYDIDVAEVLNPERCGTRLKSKSYRLITSINVQLNRTFQQLYTQIWVMCHDIVVNSTQLTNICMC